MAVMLRLRALAVMFVMLGMKALAVTFVMLGLRDLVVMFVMLGLTVRHTPPFGHPSPRGDVAVAARMSVGLCKRMPINGLRSHPLSERGARRAGCVALLETSHCWKPRVAGNLALLETSHC